MNRILFVDDEPGIRETLPAILRQHKFEVVTAATVPEALTIITSRPFDVLITDLNIGSAGDGFTVVSAMRRTQPNCITFILTGFPGFDTALQAIRSQVDDYLLKPARPQKLIEVIQSKLTQRTVHPQILTRRLSAILRDNFEAIVQRTIKLMAADAEMAGVHISDEDRITMVRSVLKDVLEALESPEPGRISADSLEVITNHGNSLRERGYTAPLLIANVRWLQCATYEIAHENLLALNLSYLLPDLMKLNDLIMLLAEAAVKAYLESEERAA